MDHQEASVNQAPTSLVHTMLTAAHVVFAGQQALRADSIKPLQLAECVPSGRRQQAVPLLSGAQADALVAELEDF